jgi:hypothetical protein
MRQGERSNPRIDREAVRALLLKNLTNRQIAEWPAGIHFEDAAVGREPMFRGTPPAFGFSVTGNSSAMCSDKDGFI